MSRKDYTPTEVAELQVKFALHCKEIAPEIHRTARVPFKQSEFLSLVAFGLFCRVQELEQELASK
jgi:hypothetical protein